MTEAEREGAIAAAMRQDGQPEVVITAFLRARARIRAGDTGLLPESEIVPAGDVPDVEQLLGRADLVALGQEAMATTAVIKLNGGLGTSMGMRGPKSLVEVRAGLTFLDLVARQVLAARAHYGTASPLLLMNSFATRDASLAHLRRYPALDVGLPLDFVQHRVPKLRADDLTLVDAANPLAWCPPGHGDLYPALVTSGLLGALRDRGIQTLFVSNIDNLGATLDPLVLGYLRSTGAPMLMEVADRTVADRKGGHLCRRAVDGGLLLREIAQCPAADHAAFVDVSRHRAFNTNSLYLDVNALARALDAHGGALPLAPIVNRKTLDPNDPSSLPVVQLESAMGAALAELEGAVALRVPRARFAPVKTTADLLALRSDRFAVDPEQGTLTPVVAGACDVVLDGPYRTVEELAVRFPAGAPSLRAATRLHVRGDVRFGADVCVHGDVTISAPAGGQGVIAAGAVLRGVVEADAVHP